MTSRHARDAVRMARRSGHARAGRSGSRAARWRARGGTSRLGACGCSVGCLGAWVGRDEVPEEDVVLESLRQRAVDDRRGRLRGAAARQLPLGGEGDPGDREPSSGRRRGGARVDWATSSPRIRKRSAASRFAESERLRHKHGTGWSACFPVVKHFRKRLGLIRSSDQVGLAQYNVYEARTHFSRLIERAATGEEIVIARAGEPLVKLVPYRNEPRVPGVISAQIVFDPVRLPPGRL